MLRFTHPVGYYKDLAAVIVFTISLALYLYTGRLPHALVVAGLSACILLDGAYSLNPTWHCSPVGDNVPTYALGAQVLMIAIFGLLWLTVYAR